MNILFKKVSLGFVLATSFSYAYGADFFSFGVLKLNHHLTNEQPWVKVIKTQKEWQLHFDELTRGLVFIAPELPPTIDFDQYQVITGGLGVKPTGGYSVVVDRVDELSDAVYISVLEVSPGNGCPVTLATTYPSTAIVIKKITKPIKFSLSKLTRICSG
jgi:hypothetical protein